MVTITGTQLQLALARTKRRKLRRGLKPKHPTGLEMLYQQRLAVFVKNIADVVDMYLLPQLNILQNADRVDTAERTDASGKDLLRILAQMGILINARNTQRDIELAASEMASSVSSWNKTTIAENINRVVGISPFFPDSNLGNIAANFTAFNTNLITSLQKEAIDKVGNKVFLGFQQGVRAEDIAKDIRQYIDPSVGNIRARANLIARDQVSKLNGQLTHERHNELGVRRYRWRTLGDDAVRPSHANNNGKIYSWDDPPLETGHPGDDYQCRCYAEPVLEDLVPGMGLDN